MLKFNSGTYEGMGRGFRGKLFVSVTVSADRIEDVQITKHKEVRGIAWDLNTTPIELHPKHIVEYQSLNIPTVCGADVTSQAILDAVAAALVAAGATEEMIAALKAAPGPVLPKFEDEVREVDLLVIGAGIAGLGAVIEAKEGGQNVLLIEKQGITGGATARSGGKLLGAGSKWQKKQGIYDTPEMVYDYLVEVGNRHGDFIDKTKVRYWVDHLNECLDWLCERGYQVQDVEQIHMSLQPWRVHNSMGGGGQTNGQGGEITTVLTQHYENVLGGEVAYNTALKSLIQDETGRVTGAICERSCGAKLTVYAKNGVVITTGGYARNEEMLAMYPVKNYFSNTPKGNVGDGLIAAESIGAKNFKHPSVQVVYTSMTCGIGINDESGLIVNERGERVVDEFTYQYTVSDALARSGSNCGFYITSGKDPYAGVQYGYQQAIEGKSRDKVADSIEELATMIKCDPAVLKATYDRYCSFVEKGVDEDFNKPAEFLHPVDGPKYVALRMHPCAVVTYGGLDIDISARVLDKDGKIIDGLYAAGEVAGTGLYGTQYPSCGTSIGSGLFYGRVAGRVTGGLPML